VYLTKEDEKILSGAQGLGFQKAMEVLVAIGDIFDAEKLIEISSSHLSSVAYESSGDTGIRFLEKMIEDGAFFKVLTTLNPHSIEYDRWKELAFPISYVKKQLRNIEAYRKLGAMGTFTCTPFLVGNCPRYGEHVSWAESSALSYINTVIGARTNRESALSALCAGLLGKTPLYGFHLDENRKGAVLVEVETELRHGADYSAMGYNVGKKVEGKVPVFTHIPGNIRGSDINALCAALAVSGAVPMVHIVGITPEAPTLEKAFRNDKPEEKINFDRVELKETYDAHCMKGSGIKIDLAVLGCPHYWYDQLAEAAKLLTEKKIHKDVDLWINTSSSIMTVAKRAGYIDLIEASGAKVMCSYCPAVTRNFFDWKTMATDSSKQTFYGQGVLGVDVLFGTTEQVINAAISGKWDEKE
jgi:predicted aconitase